MTDNPSTDAICDQFNARFDRLTRIIDDLRDQQRVAGDSRAQMVAGEVARRGRGGARALAGELGLSEPKISQMVARARTNTEGARLASALPFDVLARLWELELAELSPTLTSGQWQQLAWLLHGIAVDPSWTHDPAGLLADEIRDSDEVDPDIAATVQQWSRTQVLAVIDTCLRGELDRLPTTETR